MPKNITNAYYPHFSALDDSTYTGDTLVSNGKITDFEDEATCGQSTTDLSLLSSVELKDDQTHATTEETGTMTGYVSPDGSNTGNTESFSGFESSDSGTVSLTKSPREKPQRVKSTTVEKHTVFREEDFADSSDDDVDEDETAFDVEDRCDHDLASQYEMAAADSFPQDSVEVASKAESILTYNNDQDECDTLDLPYRAESVKKAQKYDTVDQTERQAPRVPLAQEAQAILESSGYHAAFEQHRKRADKLKKVTQTYFGSRDDDDEFVYLENVDYYSDIDVASCNQDLSTACSLTNEVTQDIFCKRMVPLEIPISAEDDEISAFSTVNGASPAAISVRGNGDSQRAVQTFQGAASNREQDRLLDPMKLDHVDYHSAVDLASHHKDISTVGGTITYQVAHAAFDRTASVPTEIPVVYDEDEISTINGSIYKIVIEVDLHRQDSGISLLGSDSIQSGSSHEKSGPEEEVEFDQLDKAGSEDAVRPPREHKKKAPPREPSQHITKKDYPTHSRKQDHREHSCKQSKDESGRQDYREHSHKQSKDESGVHKGHPAKSVRQNKTDRVPASNSRSELIPGQSKNLPNKMNSEKFNAPAELEAILNAKVKPRPKESSAAKLSPKSSKRLSPDATPRHDNRTQKMLARPRILSAASSDATSLYIDSSSPKKKEKSCKPPLDLPFGKHATNNHDRKKRERRSQEKNSERKSRSSHHERASSHQKTRLSDMPPKRKPAVESDPTEDSRRLLQVEYYSKVDTASNHQDLSTIGNRISKNFAKGAFSKRAIPYEIPIEDSDDVSTIQCDVSVEEPQNKRKIQSTQPPSDRSFDHQVDDVELGLQKESLTKEAQAARHSGDSKSTCETIKREAVFYWKRGKAETVILVLKAKTCMAPTVGKVQRGSSALAKKVHDKSGPRVQKLMADFVVQWHKYMDGRSTTEKVFIFTIATSLFVLFILLIVVVAK
jgi:hypothetical protein